MRVDQFFLRFFLVFLFFDLKVFCMADQSEILKKTDIFEDGDFSFFENSKDTESEKLLAARDRGRSRSRGVSSSRPSRRSSQPVRRVDSRPVRTRSASLPKQRTIKPRPRSHSIMAQPKIRRSEGRARAPKPPRVSRSERKTRVSRSSRVSRPEKKNRESKSPRVSRPERKTRESRSLGSLWNKFIGRREPQKKRKKEARVKSRLNSEKKGVKFEREARRRDRKASRRSRLRQGHTGLALKHGRYAGVALGRSLKRFRHPNRRRYWGPRHYFRNVGFWYYPSWGFWYYPDFSCWYYPWSRSWFFYDWNFWYYPAFNFNIYLANERRRIVFLDNDSDDDLFYAIYLRRQVDDEYYLYRVDEPLIIQSRGTAKVYLPRDKDKEYIVLAEKEEDKLSENMVQDESGNVEQTSEEVARTDSEEQRSIKVKSLSKKEISKLNEIKNKISDKKEQLKQKSSEIEDIKDPDAQIEQDAEEDEKED